MQANLKVAGILMGDAQEVGQAMDSECIVEPARGPCIPGFRHVKSAAKAAGPQILPDCLIVLIILTNCIC